MIAMPELITTTKDQAEADEYKFLAQYALEDENYKPKPLRAVVVVPKFLVETHKHPEP
jgi:hypothetical protein|tara:strand:- start:66 stop:239 length:174 start_codon:yes stop_codon:yes gene_type:complete